MKVVHFVLNIAVLLIAVMAIFTFGPLLETKFFPVYSKFQLINATASDKGTSAQFMFTKFRNCDPQGWAFFNGELGQAFYQIPVNIHGGPDVRIRPLGTQQSYVYEFHNVTPEQLASTVFAEIYSHCHPLWLTRSIVYP